MKAIFSIGVLWLFTSMLVAQDFEVSPVVLNFELEPGEIETRTVNVTNYSNVPHTFQLELFDEGYKGDDIIKNLAPGTVERSLSEWLTYSPNYFDLNPNETQQVEVTLSVPPDGYDTRWSVIYVRATQERTPYKVDKNVATGLFVSPRIKITIMQSPESNKNYSAKILSFQETQDGETKGRDFSVLIRNTGGKIILPKVFLLLANVNNGKERKLEPVGTSLMPGQERTVNIGLPADVAPGKYALAAVMDYGHSSDLEVVQMIIEVE